MAQLAIKGHSTRGHDVIEILEMLGGRKAGYSGRGSQYYYYIDNFGNIMGTTELPNDIVFKVFTLEEFIEKFPYKVGDKVKTIYEKIGIINKPIWSNRDNCIRYELKADTDSFYFVNELQPYKEETMEKEISGAIVDRFICLEGYDFYDDKGNIIDTKKITMKKKQPKYPKTFVECAKILDCFCAAHIDGYYCRLLEDLQALLICRDAYWKIAGDWEPDVMYGDLYCIGYDGNVITWKMQGGCRLLAFPTEEMRDAFYENFKELIEECKELL